MILLILLLGAVLAAPIVALLVYAHREIRSTAIGRVEYRERGIW